VLAASLPRPEQSHQRERGDNRDDENHADDIEDVHNVLPFRVDYAAANVARMVTSVTSVSVSHTTFASVVHVMMFLPFRA
jgi:hypothetical protein